MFSSVLTNLRPNALNIVGLVVIGITVYNFDKIKKIIIDQFDKIDQSSPFKKLTIITTNQVSNIINDNIVNISPGPVIFICCYSEIESSDYIVCYNSLFDKSPEPHIYCSVCINRHIDDELNSGKCSLKCMKHIDGCNYIFTHGQIRQHLTGTTLNKFNDWVTIQDVLQRALNNKDYQICPECRMSGCVVNNAEQYYTCDKCKMCWCKLCRLEFHSNLECGIFEKVDKEEKIRNVIRELLTDGHRKCPHCNTKYIKEEGCDHITCKTCGGESCYCCGKAYIFKTKQCLCVHNMSHEANSGTNASIKFEKEAIKKCEKIILKNKNEKVKKIMVNEMKKRGHYVPYAISGDLWGSIKHTLFG